MKKLVAIVIVFILIPTMSFAQVTWGTELGFNFANFNGANQNMIGLRIGLSADIKFSHIVDLHTGLFYSVKGAALQGGTMSENSISINYLEIPFVTSFVVSERFSLLGGTYMGVVLGSSIILNGEPIADYETSDIVSGLDFGAHMGFSVALSRLWSINAAYQIGFLNMDPYDYEEVYNSTILTGFTYYLGG